MRGLSLLLVLIVAWVVADVANATGGSITKPKPKPNRCDDGCGFGATCRSGECVCRSKREGDGDFVCYTPRFYYLCQIASDPLITTTDKQVSGIKMPSSLALTKLTTRRLGKGRGVCAFTLNAWTERFGGKYFIEALEFQLGQKIKGQPASVSKIRIISNVVDNAYWWTIWESTPTGWVKIAEIKPKSKRNYVTTKGKCTIRFLKMKSNFLYVNILCCAIRLAIRPYNPDKPKLVPGVWMMVRKWALLNSLPMGLCNNGTDSPNIDTLKSEYGMESRTQYMTFTGLAYGEPVQYPGSYPDLPALQNTLRTCQKGDAGQLMTKSEFLFNFAKLIACEGDRIMDITFNVAKGFCNNDQVACNAAITAINTDCPNVKPNKQLKRFLQNGCT